MHRSSESIAALAAALAKAQSELSNPEKSLVATIRPDRPGEGTRTFRYAPLSSGLDIVRKALGQQQIATVQTTAIDAATATVNLTTMLAHASGEWIASEWPVCRVADTASPHRMGAALTYARRYALFALVGIAGEDDLDAPDLNGRSQADWEAPTTGISESASVPKPSRRPRGNRPPSVDPETSAALRDRLVREVAALASADEAAHWARTALETKNRLLASDGRLIELAFELRLSALAEESNKSRQQAPRPPEEAVGHSNSAMAATKPVASPGGDLDSERPNPPSIDKSALTIGEPRRYRDQAHIKFVASRSCLVCGRQPCDPHHLRFTQPRALGRKVSDEFTVPLCRLHHRELHRSRNEPLWWKKLGIDPIRIARELWDRTRSSRRSEAPTSEDLPVGAAAQTEIKAGRYTRRAKRARAVPAPGTRADTKAPSITGPSGP